MITIGGMLVLAKGIVQTGVVTGPRRLLADHPEGSAGVARLMGPVGVASALMNTTPLVAMLIPATRELEQARGIPAREGCCCRSRTSRPSRVP